MCALASNLGILTLCQAKARPAGAGDDTKTVARVLKPYIDNHEIAGAVVLIADRDLVTDRDAIGYANLANHAPMRADNMFWIASMSKAMTAAAVMMLVDEGKISLDDPVEKYLPEFKAQKVLAHADTAVASSTAGSSTPVSDKNAAAALEPLNQPITIRELLSHTAGLPFRSKRETPALDLLPLKTAVESYAAEPLESQPGAKYSYSNEGFNTAGRIVEIVSGFGWNVGPGFFEHSGAYKTDMKVDVKRGLIVVLMVQHANDWKSEERERLMNALEETAIHSGMVSPNGVPTASNITTEEQSGIDEDVARHLGDVSADPGPKANLSPSTDPVAVHAAMRKVADWELKRAEPYLTQNWTWAVLDTGFMAASRELNDPRYSNAMRAMAERFHWELGKEDPVGRGSPDSNDQALAQTYLELYLQDPSPEKIGPARQGLDSWLAGQMPPIPDDQFQILWWWCDTLFMSPPAWAEMARATRDRKYLDYLNKRWWETSGALYDPQYHLFYRDKSFIGQKGAAGKPIFWSRGNGWVMGGLARTLAYMPQDYPDRSRFENQMRALAAEFASIQDPKSGLWHSDLLDASVYPQPEISGSALITLGLAWGVNHGVLDRASYTPVIERAWRGMMNEIYMDGRLGNIQQTGGAPNYFLPGSSYNFGVGAFLLAGEQVAHLGTHSRP
jgi:rhamnogalacturonyl hydrolase YesR